MRRWLFALIVAMAAATVAIHAQADPMATGSLAAAGDAVTLSMANIPSASIQIIGTWTGVVVFEASNDAGTTWYAVTVVDQQVANGSMRQQTSANGLWALANAGYTTMRVRALVLSSGTAAVTVTKGLMAGAVPPPCNALLRAARQC